MTPPLSSIFSLFAHFWPLATAAYKCPTCAALALYKSLYAPGGLSVWTAATSLSKLK